MVKNPPCNAGDVNLIAGGGIRIPRELEPLGPSSAATEPVCCSGRACVRQPQPWTEVRASHSHTQKLKF